MNAELEALLLAFDAVIQARSGAEANSLEAIYRQHFEEVLEQHPNLSREALQHAVDFAYLRWVRAQQKPSAVPPKA